MGVGWNAVSITFWVSASVPVDNGIPMSMPLVKLSVNCCGPKVVGAVGMLGVEAAMGVLTLVVGRGVPVVGRVGVVGVVGVVMGVASGRAVGGVSALALELLVSAWVEAGCIGRLVGAFKFVLMDASR